MRFFLLNIPSRKNAELGFGYDVHSRPANRNISPFSANREDYHRMMNAIIGGCVYGIIIIIAVYMLHDTRNFTVKIKTCPLNELYLVTPEYLTPYLSYIKEHQRLFRAAIKATVLGIDNTYQRMFRYIFTPIPDRFGVPAPDRAYAMAFFIQGLMGIIQEWLKNDCDAPVEYIVKMIEKCISNRWEKE